MSDLGRTDWLTEQEASSQRSMFLEKKLLIDYIMPILMPLVGLDFGLFCSTPSQPTWCTATSNEPLLNDQAQSNYSQNNLQKSLGNIKVAWYKEKWILSPVFQVERMVRTCQRSDPFYRISKICSRAGRTVYCFWEKRGKKRAKCYTLCKY